MLLRRILRDDAWKFAAYTIILVGNAAATVLSFPTFEQNYGMILNLVPSFLKNLHQALESAGSGGLPAFASINHLFKGANVIGVAVAILLAMGTIVREVEIGTIGMLLSRPISRTRILLSFVLAHVLELIVPLFVATLSIPLLANLLIDREVELAPLLLGTVHAAAFLLFVYSIALLIATLAAEQLVAAGIAGGICVVSFILYFIDATRPFTLYRFSSLEGYAALARGDSLDPLATGGLAVAAAVIVGGTALVFTRKDY